MIAVHDKVREGTVWFKSGHFYSMYYLNYENDPTPVAVMLNYVNGTHPRTGHLHRYIQMINLTYIPRSYRRLFVESWGEHLKINNGNVLLTWRKVLRKYPFLKFALRRYLVGRNFIRYPKEIKEEDYDKIVISSFTRDFSIAAWKVALKLRAGKKGSIGRHTVANKTLSKNALFRHAFAGPV